MASVFKHFLQNDIVPTRTLLHEAIPITGSLITGTYLEGAATETSIKQFSHGFFESVYDYPHLSSSANHIFDLSMGYSNDSGLSASANIQNRQKINMYNHMAQVLMGYDHTGSIVKFDEDGNLLAGGTKIKEAYFMCFSRLLVKDEIKKGSFTLELGRQVAYNSQHESILTITDANAQNDFRVNSPTGEYGILSCSLGGAYSGNVAPASGSIVSNGFAGLIFYQAGIVVLTASVFASSSHLGGKGKDKAQMLPDGTPVETMFMTSYITASTAALRHRIKSLSFNNTTELNSTLYFCRINNNDYNYSSNPSYVTGSKVVVKNNTLDSPVTYITTVGFYSSDNELLAVAKLSEPLKKDPTNELIIRGRADF